MTDLTLNTRLTADASGLNAALRDGAGGVRQFSAQAETAARQAAQAGQQMVGAAQAQGAALRAQQEAMRRARAEANLLANANRQLPMQITDIVTSLASGMPAWMVAIQQGGQLRDSYNGILPAGRAIAGLFNVQRLAIGGLVGGLAALTAAYFAGQAESQAHARAVTLSGGAAGVTAGQMDQMARSIDNTVGTQRAAAAVLVQLAEGGRVSRASLQGVAETVVRMERDLGIATEEAVGMFEALGREPVKAAAKLNEQFNFLTVAVYEQIRALQEQGRELDAAALAQATFANAMSERAQQTEERLGTLQRAWRGVKDFAAEAWDAMLGIGRADTADQRLAQITAQIQRMEAAPTTGVSETRLAVRRDTIAALREEQAALQELQRMEQRSADQRAADAAATRAYIAGEKEREDAAKRAERERERAAEKAAREAERRRQEQERAAQADEERFQRELQAWQDRTAAAVLADEARARAQAEGEASRLEDSNRALGEEIQALGLTGRALLAVEQARISSTIATKEQALASMLAARGGYDSETLAIERQIAALRERQGLLAQRTVRQDQVDQQRTADQARQQEEADAKRRTEAFADSISQGILEGYRQGRSLTDIFLQELRAQFAKTVLQPVIQPLAQSGSDLLTMLINGAVGLFGGGGGGDTYSNPGDTGAPGPRAGGGRMEPYGDYWVGEQGPERVRMGGRGAYVYPAHASLGGGSGRAAAVAPQQVLHINIDSRTDRAEVMGSVMQAVRAGNAELLDMMRRGEV